MRLATLIVTAFALAGAAVAETAPAQDAHARYDAYLQAVADGDDARADREIEAAFHTARATLAQYHPDTALFAFMLAQIRVVQGNLGEAQQAAEFALEASVYAQHYREDEARILYGASLTETDPARARAELEQAFAEWDRLVEGAAGGAPDLDVLDNLYSWSWRDRYLFDWAMTLPALVDSRASAGVAPRDDVTAARLYLASLQAAAGALDAASASASLAHYDLWLPPRVISFRAPARWQHFMMKAGQIEYLAGQYERALSAFMYSAARWRAEPLPERNLASGYLPSGEMAPALGNAFAWMTLAEESLRASGRPMDIPFHDGPISRMGRILPGRDTFIWPINIGRDCRYRWQPREPLAFAEGDSARLGAVTLQFDFNGRGEVTNARIAGSAPVPSPEHEAAILAAAESWRATFSTPFSIPRGCRTDQIEMVHYYY